jgi:hypothetical protein
MNIQVTILLYKNTDPTIWLDMTGTDEAVESALLLQEHTDEGYVGYSKVVELGVILHEL